MCVQLVSGVEGAAYWLSTYGWDLCNYLVPMVFSAIIILAFNNASFVGVNFGATILSFLLYGFSVISFSYFLSFAFDEPGTYHTSAPCAPLCSVASHERH